MRTLLTTLTFVTGCSADIAPVAQPIVPLRYIHANPASYEGKIITTCGVAPVHGSLLYIKDWRMGRSRGAMRLDRSIDSQTGCIEAEVARWTGKEASIEEQQQALSSHPNVIPHDWCFKVRRVDP